MNNYIFKCLFSIISVYIPLLCTQTYTAPPNHENFIHAKNTSFPNHYYSPDFFFIKTSSYNTRGAIQDFQMYSPPFSNESKLKELRYNVMRNKIHRFSNTLSIAAKKITQERYLDLGSTFAIGAAFANTSVDQRFANWCQHEIRNDVSNGFSRIFEPFGRTKCIVSGYIATVGTSLILKDHPVGHNLGLFSRRYLETMALGLPPVWLLQRMIGADRPSKSADSRWQLFKHAHGVSGHAFAGAVPFLTTAKMVKHPVVKGACYALSTFTGLTRLNDNAHYLSQVVMGWSLAYLSTNAVFDIHYSQRHSYDDY